MKDRSLFWGIVLILIGVVLLLDQLNIFQNINLWGILWPLFMIVMGGWILWNVSRGPRPAGEPVTLNLPLEGARQAAITLHHGAGHLTLNSNAAPGTLLSGTFGGGAEHQLDREGDQIRLKVKSPDLDWFIPGIVSPEGRFWDVGLTREIPLTLHLQMGANEARVDLHELQVSDLKMETGASNTDLTLPAAGNIRVRIECGAASLTLRIPESIAARIRVESGVSSITVDPHRFPRLDRYYQSLDYETAPHRADIEIEAGAGSINIL